MHQKDLSGTIPNVHWVCITSEWPDSLKNAQRIAHSATQKICDGKDEHVLAALTSVYAFKSIFGEKFLVEYKNIESGECKWTCFNESPSLTLKFPVEMLAEESTTAKT